jgi:ribonuclease BN (tRNA processing enzyme)
MPGFQDDETEKLDEVMTARGLRYFASRAYHMDVSEVAQLAQEANVERLALTHLMPSPGGDAQMNQWFVNPIREIYDGEVFCWRRRPNHRNPPKPVIDMDVH